MPILSVPMPHPTLPPVSPRSLIVNNNFFDTSKTWNYKQAVEFGIPTSFGDNMMKTLYMRSLAVAIGMFLPTGWVCADVFASPAPSASDARTHDPGSALSDSLYRPAFLDNDSQSFGNQSFERPYVGGRGMISASGMSGMFINPTSGTLPQGDFTVQYCLYINNLYGSHFNTDHVVGHGVMADYGVTDWLDVGLFGQIALVPGLDTRWFDNAAAVGGPFARVRVLKEQGFLPEVSIGGIFLDGTRLGEQLIAKREAFIAMSKGFDIDPDGFLRSVRVHAGYRYLSRPQASGPFGGDREFVYGGGEIGLPFSLYAIGEVSSNNFIHSINNSNLPWAAGFQWRPNSVLGISVAYEDPEDHQLGLLRGLWFGFGFNFKL